MILLALALVAYVIVLETGEVHTDIRRLGG